MKKKNVSKERMKSNILTKSLLNFPKIHTNEKKNNNSNTINNIKAFKQNQLLKVQ